MYQGHIHVQIIHFLMIKRGDVLIAVDRHQSSLLLTWVNRDDV